MHWLGRDVVLCALALPVVRYGSLSVEYAALLVASVGLLLTSGRLTSELNFLLGQARLQAESAETLLLAGDIAARVADRGERAGERGHADPLPVHESPGAEQRASDRRALERLVGGDALQVTLTTALERACLCQALELFARRPAGTRLSVNLSAPVLLDPLTRKMLDDTRAGDANGLEGLIVEITEETLVHADMELARAIAPLTARGAHLAIDDMGAGYSGLRQIPAVRPGYLKLDRSLISGIDRDSERAALVGALAGYASQVGSMLVAEGVETEAELAVVRGLGVPLVQGFYFSRPASPWPELNAGTNTPPTATQANAERPAVEPVGVLQPAA